MRTYLLTTLAAGLSTVSVAQKAFILSHQDKKGFVDASAGVSVPIGHFASCSPLDEQASMAGRGLAFNVSAGYRLMGRVGLMVRGEHLRNGVQTNSLINALYRNDTDQWTANAGNWAVTTLMAGPYVTIPLSRFSVDARLLGGRMMATLPGTAMAGNFGDVRIVVHTSGAESQAMAYGGGVTLRYRLGRSLSLHLNGDYTQSSLKFDNLSSVVQSNDDIPQRATFSSTRIVSVVSLSAGVSVLFGNRLRPF